MEKGYRWCRQFITEEHVTVITEPGNNFLTHITVECANAKCISDSIVDYYYSKNNLVIQFGLQMLRQFFIH